MIAAVFGALLELTYPYNWEQIDGVTPEVAAAAADTLYWDAVAESCGVIEGIGYQQDVFHRFATVNAGTVTRNNATFLTYNYNMVSDTTAGREFLQPMTLPPGDYKYRGLYAKYASAGNTEIRLHHTTGHITLVAALDQFGLFNAEFEYSTTFTLTDPTVYEIMVRNTGSKNASSSGFSVNWTSHHFERTG